jgi:hypothetical protein
LKYNQKKFEELKNYIKDNVFIEKSVNNLEFENNIVSQFNVIKAHISFILNFCDVKDEVCSLSDSDAILLSQTNQSELEKLKKITKAEAKKLGRRKLQKMLKIFEVIEKIERIEKQFTYLCGLDHYLSFKNKS